MLPLTVGFYTGWLFVATVANSVARLVKMKWNSFGIVPEIWGIMILSIAILLVLGVSSSLRNAAFPLPIAWAYFGSYQLLKAPEGLKGELGFLRRGALYRYDCFSGFVWDPVLSKSSVSNS